ncbi:MAG: acetyl-CoA C-acetyltransferase [Rhodospirillales bacterium]|nr:acetyl-CoA C-acetyltransferase [Rhodospirillales bacterium]USO08626.1 MAG: acetyl-CoA C-acetyltransferase [Rhodospirillales bacterium]
MPAPKPVTGDSIVIVAAKRTAVANFNGALADMPAHQLGATVIKAALSDAGVKPDEVDEVVLGQVLTAAAGQGPARQAAMAAGIPAERTAYTINQICGSGLRAVALGYQAIALGDAAIMVCGGQESMSQSPHAVHMRAGIKFGDAKLTDTMIKDGLWDAFNDYHMGITAENVAAQAGVDRARQDALAATSQQRAEAARASGRFKAEIAPVTFKRRKEEITFDSDEFIRPGVTAQALSTLKPAFKPDGGSVTAGNASGLNDGAAVVVLMRASEAEKRGLKPFARIVSWASAGVDPAVMGTGPIPASKKALDKAGWTVADLDLVESNEAFAAQACCVMDGLKLDPEKTNVNGGAIAIGHPIGASGARILVTLLHEMARRDAQKGLATLCIGGGMGVAMCVARDDTMEWKTVE